MITITDKYNYNMMNNFDLCSTQQPLLIANLVEDYD